jgi:hypothetical protein
MVGVEIGLCASASLLLCVLGIFCLKYHCHNQIVQPIIQAPKYEGYIDCPPKYEAQYTDPSTMT